ncbi:MAG: hypothetical protein ACI4RF_01360, partial [Eubacterium sp.]
DKVVYCLYNECDNGVWFGETKESSDSTYGVYGEYNETGEQNFFDAWKITYDLVKSINPDALIGGPGFYEYESGKIERFLTYCAENDCVPEIMIYHELNDSSVYHWQSHVKDYRLIEEKLGIGELPIIVTEYGRMQDNGLPGKMLQYITQIETSKVYADNAFWRLADNLCDVAADDNSPNSNWWLYRWYTDMEGQTVDIKYQDLFKSNLGKALKGEAEFSSQGFMGIVTITDNEDKIDIICGGRDGSAVVKLKNIDATAFAGKTVKITVEETVYKGISGIVNAPVVLSETYQTLSSSTLKLDMNDMEESNAYHITITPVENTGDDYVNDGYIERYEFEDGELLGDAYTYDSAYATTGEKDGLVGGIEKPGDGVALTFTVPQDDNYYIDIVFGNSNNGGYDMDGRQDPDDRTYSSPIMYLDGNEKEISFPSTIKSEYTDCMSLAYELKAGKHTITFKYSSGTVVFDSMVVSTVGISNNISILSDADRTTDTNKSFLIVSPDSTYYSIDAGKDVNAKLNGNDIYLKNGGSDIFLMKGLNYIDVESESNIQLSASWQTEHEASSLIYFVYNAELSDGAKVDVNDSGINTVRYLSNISCNGGKAEFNVNVSKTGTYALTLKYANNDEGGKHDYNVDLIERYVTITANGKSQDVYCRNTYSWDTYKEVTCYVDLKKGSNTVAFTNSGNNKFDNQDTYIPYITSFTISEICK